MDINVSDEEIDVDNMNKKCDVELKTDEKSISTSPKPGVSYIALISMAIQSSPMKKMLLSEIYNWISENHSYYKMEERSWRNSIRHNLSLNECFIKSGRCENGKGNYWSIHPANIDDFAKGDFHRRRARRRVRKCDEELQKLVSCNDECDDVCSVSEEPHCTSVPQNAYVPMANTWTSVEYLTSIFGVEAILSQEERNRYFCKNNVSRHLTPQNENYQHCYPINNDTSFTPVNMNNCSGYIQTSTINVNVHGIPNNRNRMIPSLQDTFSGLRAGSHSTNRYY